ncbi:MAG: recombinase family protein, partial [Nitratireductor sp.]
MKSCFGYVRVSTQKQGEGVSLEAQKDAILRFAAGNEIEITAWFEEKQTAAKSGRPVFATMLKALRRRKADGVVMHKIDRSARNFADWAKIGELADAGIDVHFATESLDFRSRGGRLSADIQAVIAADYIRNLRDETIKGINGRLKQGLYPFWAPIGYCNNGGGKPKTPDPNKAQHVRRLFELYASGQHSINSLRKEIEQHGLRNSRGKPVSKTGIETILNNPFYCGLIRIKRTGAVYEGVHEPLISPALFDRVQEIKANKSGKKVTRHNHTYRGLFRCANCARAMIAERQKGHVYYRCHEPSCPTKCVREEDVEEEVRQVLSRIRLS